MSFFRTHVEFRSDAFPAYPGEENGPDIWGRRLAEFLEAKLRARGVASTGRHPGRLGLGHSIGEWKIPDVDRLRALRGISRRIPRLYRALKADDQEIPLFRKVDATEDVSRVAAVLDEI